MVAAADYADAGHHPGGHHHRHSRGQQRERFAHLEPGGAGVAAARLPCFRCCISPVRASGWEIGKLGWFLLTRGLGQRHSDHRHGHLRPAGLAEISLACDRRQMMLNGRAYVQDNSCDVGRHPTDRAIIEHVKALAKLAHSRVVLLHVADGWAARTYGPDAVSREITEDTAYLEKCARNFNPPEFPPRRNWPLANRPRKSSNGSSKKAMRPGGHEHPRPPFPGRLVSRHHRQPCPAQHQRACAFAPGEVIHNFSNRRWISSSVL